MEDERDSLFKVIPIKNKPNDLLNNFFSPWTYKINSNNSTEKEIFKYFFKSSTTNLDSLDENPLIKKVFIKYNTPLPSSASIEHIFSVGSAVMTKKRGTITDANFEKVMMIKFNNFFCKIKV